MKGPEFPTLFLWLVLVVVYAVQGLFWVLGKKRDRVMGRSESEGLIPYFEAMEVDSRS